jgi:hypothetical protein
VHKHCPDRSGTAAGMVRNSLVNSVSEEKLKDDVRSKDPKRSS